MGHFEIASITLFTSFTSAGRCWLCLGVFQALQHFCIQKMSLMWLQEEELLWGAGLRTADNTQRMNWFSLLSLATFFCKVYIIFTQAIPALQPLPRDSSCLTRFKDLQQHEIQILFVSKYLKQGQCNISVTYPGAARKPCTTGVFKLQSH